MFVKNLLNALAVPISLVTSFLVITSLVGRRDHDLLVLSITSFTISQRYCYVQVFLVNSSFFLNLSFVVSNMFLSWENVHCAVKEKFRETYYKND